MIKYVHIDISRIIMYKYVYFDTRITLKSIYISIRASRYYQLETPISRTTTNQL